MRVNAKKGLLFLFDAGELTLETAVSLGIFAVHRVIVPAIGIAAYPATVVGVHALVWGAIGLDWYRGLRDFMKFRADEDPPIY